MLTEETAKVVGQPSEGTNSWKLAKQVDGKFSPCEWPEAGVYVAEWPIGEFSLDTISTRWGAGTYRTTWLIRDDANPDPGLRHAHGGMGRKFRIAEPPAPAAPPPVHVAPPPPPTPMADPFALAERYTQMVNGQAAAQIQGMISLAGAMQGNNANNGIAAMIAAQGEMFRSMLAAQAERDARLFAMLAAQGEDEEEEDDSPAAPREPLFRPGEPTGEAAKAALLNMLADSGPGIAEFLKGMIAAAVAKSVAEAQAAPAPPPAPPVEAPPLLPNGAHP